VRFPKAEVATDSMDKENGFLTLSSLRPLRDCQGSQLSESCGRGDLLFAYSRENSRSPAPQNQIHAAANDMAAERGMTVRPVFTVSPRT
jgi:hypothetical protein